MYKHYSKTRNPIKNWTKDLRIPLTQKVIHMTHEKMLDIYISLGAFTLKQHELALCASKYVNS